MISILIPAYNEAARIQETIAAVKLMTQSAESEVIVVDDGSTDATASVAKAAGADTVLKQSNLGKGAALAAAFRSARGDVLLLLDADLGATASEASKLLQPVLAGDAEMTIAAFPVIPGRGGGMGLVVRTARYGIRMLTGRTLRAPLSGQRALKRTVLESAGGFAPGWGVEISLTVRALWAGCRVEEVETAMDHRVTGRSLSSVAHRAAQMRAAIRVLTALALEKLCRAPKERQRYG